MDGVLFRRLFVTRLAVLVFLARLLLRCSDVGLVTLGGLGFGTLGQAVGQDGDLFARRSQADLGGANRVFAVAQL